MRALLRGDREPWATMQGAGHGAHWRAVHRYAQAQAARVLDALAR